MKPQGTTKQSFITRWWNNTKKNFREGYEHRCELERKGKERAEDDARRWKEEEERERKDWEQLTPFQRSQIRELKKIRHSTSDGGYESAYAGWGEP